MMYSSDSSHLLYICIYVICNRREISTLREYRLWLWSFISVFLMYSLLMACCKAETRSWAIYKKIYVVLDGCLIWIYCFSAYNTIGWAPSIMLKKCLWNLPCWAHRQQVSLPSGPKGVDFMFVYTHWQVQPASETRYLENKYEGEGVGGREGGFMQEVPYMWQFHETTTLQTLQMSFCLLWTWKRSHWKETLLSFPPARTSLKCCCPPTTLCYNPICHWEVCKIQMF